MPLVSRFAAVRALARLARFTALALACATARAQIVHQTVPTSDRDCTPTTWFQVMNSGSGSPAGHAGLLNLGTNVLGSPALIYGGWLTFSQDGTFVTYIGGTTSTVAITDPSGAPLTNVRGAALLASTLDAGIDAATGSIYTVTLYSGVVLWTAEHAYLLLLGGPPTTYEITDGGTPLAGVLGVATLAAQVPNTGTPMAPNYVLFSGAAIYSASKAWLVTTAGTITTYEIQYGGASIPGIRGFTAMGGAATPLLCDTGSFFYTAGKTYLMLTGPGIYVYEVTQPSGAPIADAWGIVRLSPEYAGGGFFQGAAGVMTHDNEWLVLVGGSIGTAEIAQPSGAPIASNVSIASANTLLHQASALQEVLAGWHGPSGTRRGTVIGSRQ